MANRPQNTLITFKGFTLKWSQRRLSLLESPSLELHNTDHQLVCHAFDAFLVDLSNVTKAADGMHTRTVRHAQRATIPFVGKTFVIVWSHSHLLFCVNVKCSIWTFFCHFLSEMETFYGTSVCVRYFSRVHSVGGKLPKGMNGFDGALIFSRNVQFGTRR